MNKILYATIDTETVGGATAPTGMYNLGAVIHDKQGNIYATTSLLVMEKFDEIRNDDYAKDNFPIYEERLSKGEISAVATEEQAVEIVRSLCKMYSVKYVMAYNSSFDFCKTPCKTLLNDFEFIDIYLMALQTVTHLKKYQRFCSDHGLKAKNPKSKNCATSVEAVYAFFNNDPDFVEEHTALSDALNEMEIFIKCDKMHKKYTRNCHQHNCKQGKCYPKMLGAD